MSGGKTEVENFRLNKRSEVKEETDVWKEERMCVKFRLRRDI